jgi:hypothetical protein
MVGENLLCISSEWIEKGKKGPTGRTFALGHIAAEPIENGPETRRMDGNGNGPLADLFEKVGF